MSLKQDKMTSSERWVALLNRQPLDRVPIVGLALGYSGLNVGYTIGDMYTDPQKTFNAQTWTPEQYGWQSLPLLMHSFFRPARELKMPEGDFAQAPMIKRFMVETEDEVWALKMPDVKDVCVGPLAVSKMGLEAGEPFVSYLFELFSLAANLPGVETFCKWMVKKPKLAHQLMRLATDFALDMSQYYADTFGAEKVMPFHGEPSAANQIISPAMFEKFVLPYIKEFYEKIARMGIKHAVVHPCGEQNANLPFWSQVKMGDPALITVGHEVDLETASKYFPNNIIMGNVEPAVIQTGTPQEVYEASRICIEKGKKHPGGYILMPGCELPPKAPPYNVWMMTKAVNDFGWYD